MEDSASASGSRGQRTLAAVLFTDGVNFSAQMSQNEERTLDLINRDLTLMRELCHQNEGRVLKSTGDGLLMCFSSAVNAVHCALEIQQKIAEAAALLPPEEALQHRIGIHLGDVYISETDVMGTGVNIAARLQGQADPGGICISQTVYDVVKPNLDMVTIYLGMRKLKNIQEEIPVYRVSRKSEEEQWAQAPHSTPTAEPLSQVVTRFTPQVAPPDAVAKELSEHEYALRIRKLLLCVCRNVWESDSDRLMQINLGELVRELVANAPTPEALQLALYRVIQSLSKRAEYEVVARVVMVAFDRLYSHQPQTTLTPLETVAQKLERAPHVERIKKLLLCVCQDIWENDPAKLNQWQFVDLLPELLEVAPSLDLLKTKLQRVVQTLNKRDAYTALANKIVQVLQPLYPIGQQPTSRPNPSILAQSIRPARIEVATPPPPPALRAPSFQPQAVSAPAPPQPPEAPAASDTPGSPPQTVNWFDIRIDLMRYTNPLRAKILMFSALQGEISLSEMGLLSLRMHPLDVLLQSLIQACPTLQDMETMLQATARKLDDADLFLQAAGSVAQAFRPIYNSPALLEVAQQKSVESNDQTLVRSDFVPPSSSEVSDEEASCQFFIRSTPNPDSSDDFRAESFAG